MRATLARNAKGKRVITTRRELAQLLRTSPDFIADVVSRKARHYGHFTIPKANGELRQIQPPKTRLKQLQRSLLDELYHRLRVPSYLHGGVPRRSTVTNARVHVGKFMVATLDIREFFPSTHKCQISPVFFEAGFADAALNDLLELATLDGALPQGAPSSCHLANLGFVAVDALIRRVCRRHELTFTRYLDDIAISGEHDFCNLKGILYQIVKSFGYQVAKRKTHFTPRGQRQVVTGFVVNETLRPTKEFIRELKHSIHLCRTEGPMLLAEAEGVTAGTIKKRLNGRVGHLMQSDIALGRRLKGLLNSVNWEQEM